MDCLEFRDAEPFWLEGDWWQRRRHRNLLSNECCEQIEALLEIAADGDVDEILRCQFALGVAIALMIDAVEQEEGRARCLAAHAAPSLQPPRVVN